MRAGPWAAAAAVLAASLTLAAPAASVGEASPARPEVAQALLDEARQYSELGDWRKAAACLDEAALQDPGNSDLLYLRALASTRLDAPFAEALGGLDGALAADRFSLYSGRDARTLKAELLVRERRWAEALDALGSPGSANSGDPAYHLARAKAMAGAGRFGAFLDEIGEGLRRFPDDGSFVRLFLARLGRLPQSEPAQRIADTILGRMKRYSEADPELPALAAPLMPDMDSRRDAVQAFRASGGISDKASLRALEYGIIDERQASAELLAGPGPVAFEDLAALEALAGSPEGRKSIHSALAAWKGEVIVDADSDGFYEARFKLDRGVVARWARDSRQEGVVDEKASFSEGLPAELSLVRPDGRIEVRYSDYPAVRLLTFERGGTRTSFAFAPEAFAYAPIALATFIGNGKDSILVPRAAGAGDPSERSAAASALSVERASGGDREIVSLDRGLPTEAVIYREGRVFASRSYEKGRPVLEREDMDGDGRFEIEKGFAGERGSGAEDDPWPVSWFRCDADGDGVFEYREQTVFPFRKEWDYDGNGSVDARRESLPDGSVKESFSSRLDGRLDEDIFVKGGRIVSVARNGVRLDLVPDANRQLTWIGRKAFDLGSELPEGEGIFSRQGRRYRLSRIGSFAFAELLP